MRELEFIPTMNVSSRHQTEVVREKVDLSYRVCGGAPHAPSSHLASLSGSTCIAKTTWHGCTKTENEQKKQLSLRAGGVHLYTRLFNCLGEKRH